MSEPLLMPESDMFVDIRMWRVGVIQQFLDPFGPTTVGGSMFQEQATNGKNRCRSVVIAMQLYGWLNKLSKYHKSYSEAPPVLYFNAGGVLYKYSVCRQL